MKTLFQQYSLYHLYCQQSGISREAMLADGMTFDEFAAEKFPADYYQIDAAGRVY